MNFDQYFEFSTLFGKSVGRASAVRQAQGGSLKCSELCPGLKRHRFYNLGMEGDLKKSRSNKIQNKLTHVSQFQLFLIYAPNVLSTLVRKVVCFDIHCTII